MIYHKKSQLGKQVYGLPTAKKPWKESDNSSFFWKVYQSFPVWKFYFGKIVKFHIPCTNIPVYLIQHKYNNTKNSSYILAIYTNIAFWFSFESSNSLLIQVRVMLCILYNITQYFTITDNTLCEIYHQITIKCFVKRFFPLNTCDIITQLDHTHSHNIYSPLLKTRKMFYISSKHSQQFWYMTINSFLFHLEQDSRVSQN